jgi:Fe-Mn family superoxide dismutase
MTMTHTLPELPYSETALEPHISRETLQYHHGKHHNAYVTKLNQLIPGTEFEKSTLKEIILKADGAIFNQAAQVWNHTFYFNCLSNENEATEPKGELLAEIVKSFGSVNELIQKFNEKAVALFGSGWVWLVKNPDGTLGIEATTNAGNPLRDGKTPLLTCDVWEHAYYIDFRNARPDYLNAFWKLVNWDFVMENLILTQSK